MLEISGREGTIDVEVGTKVPVDPSLTILDYGSTY